MTAEERSRWRIISEQAVRAQTAVRIMREELAVMSVALMEIDLVVTQRQLSSYALIARHMVENGAQE